MRSAAALAEDLRRFLAGEPIVARPVTRSERAVKWVRRRPAIAALLGAGRAGDGALGSGGVLWQWREAVARVAEQERQATGHWPSREQRGDAARPSGQGTGADRAGRATPVRRPDESRPAVLGGLRSASSCSKGSTSSSRPTRAASIAEASSGSTGGERCPRATSPSRGIPARSWSVAFSPDGKRLASASDRWDGEGVGRRDRAGNPHAQGAHRRGHERGVQPRRQADRLRQWRQDGEGVGRRDRPGDPARSRGTPTGLYAWRSAPTASGSPPPAATGR